MATQTHSSDVIDLINTIDNKMKRVHTQSLDISFNELLDMHQNDELNIHLTTKDFFDGQKEHSPDLLSLSY